MTSSLGGSSFGSPQNDQVILAEPPVPAAGACVAAGAGAAPVAEVWRCDVELLWHAARSPTPASPANRSRPRRDSRADVCVWFIRFYCTPLRTTSVSRVSGARLLCGDGVLSVIRGSD